MHPCRTIEAMLGQTRLGSLDPAALRGLLDCLSLFPIGSTVQLSNGGTAKVIRATPGCYDRPVVNTLDSNDRPTADVLHLTDSPDLKVVRVLS